jgi:hypothetical protein
MTPQKRNLDGVDITDVNATGGSPVYFDFDSFEETQISTGGNDVTMQAPGVAVNLVTKSGTDRLRGAGRYDSSTDNVAAGASGRGATGRVKADPGSGQERWKV